MAVEFISAVNVNPGNELNRLGRADIDLPFFKRYVNALEDAGFDYTLCAYASSFQDQFAIANQIVARSERVAPIIALRPNTMYPTVAAKALATLDQSLGEAQNALTGWRRPLELVTTPSAEVHDGVALPPGGVGVRVDHVSARYGNGPIVLHDVTVRIEPGEHVAVVGRTGSGKSTFAKLLTRRLEPAAGAIRLSGVPLAKLASTAGRVVIVPQDPFLFGGTLGENIRLGSPGATDEDARRILSGLGLHDWFATLPEGLSTPVGLRGERLSVGERQLVALARTALADPDLVVFDEATSGIDPATDVAVQRALAVLTRDRTTVSIAHRMITAETADRVLVFADGRVVQAGRHTELAGEPGPYAGLVAAWRHPPGGKP